MKPSERIRKLGEYEVNQNGIIIIGFDFQKGFLAYLDEEYEKDLLQANQE